MLIKSSFVAINHFLPFIKPMKGNLYKLFTYFETYKPSYELVPSTQLTSSISLKDEPFIDEHLKKDILQLKKYKQVIFKTGITTFTIHIYYQNENLEYFLELLKYTLSYVCLLGPHKKKEIIMKYYLLDVKRVLDGDNLLDKEEVNGGACMSYGEKSVISVWRKEEILKVSIHELIHGLEYDYRNDTREIISHYQSRYKVTSNKMNTFEAYTEIFAEYIHSYLLSVWYNPYNRYELFMSNVLIEREFSRFQSNKLLNLNSSFIDMNKHTNVCAYYLIKTELYNDIQSFIQYCLTKNSSFIKLKNISNYLDYLKKVNQVKKKKTYRINNYLDTTTRMTCLEIDLFKQ